MRHPLFAAGFLIVAACSKFDEAPSSAVDAGEAGEAGALPDAGVADVPIVPGTPFCSIPRAGQLFCEDFETEKAPNFGFTDRENDSSDINRMNIPGRGFVLVYQADATTSWLRFAGNLKNRDLNFTSVKLTMEVAISMQMVVGVLIAGIWVNPLPTAAPIVHALALHGNPELQASQDGVPSGPPRPIMLGAWQTITVELRSTGPGYVRHVSIAGDEVDVRAVAMPPDGEWDARIGAYYGSQTSFTMLVDNVVVTRE